MYPGFRAKIRTETARPTDTRHNKISQNAQWCTTIRTRIASEMKFEDTMKTLNALTNNLTCGDTQPSKDEPDEFTFFCGNCQEEEIFYQKKGKDYETRRCYNCGIPGHIAANCFKNTRSANRSGAKPRKYWKQKIYYEASTDEEEEEPVASSQKSVFFQSDVGNEMEDILLVGEAINQATLDCGASQTVCGTEWYKCFLESLGDDALEDVEEYN